MKTIRYYLSPQSPWTYFGHDRLAAIAARHGAAIEVRPIDLGGKVFPATGGLPVPKRSPQRQAYRLAELERWSRHLGLPLNLRPKHFPVAGDLAPLMIIAAGRRGADAAMRLTGALLAAVWAEERDIADESTLRAIGDALGLDGDALLRDAPQCRADYERYTQQAIDDGVFGVPWYVVGSEGFWGQDRLDFVERALAAA